jgi:hypothetical protein
MRWRPASPRIVLLFVLLLAGCGGGSSHLAVRWSAAAEALLASADLLRHVEALAAPAMEGRASGTPGGERAAAYIAAFMRNIDWSAVQGRYDDAVEVKPPRPLEQKQFADVPSISVEEVKAMLAAGTAWTAGYLHAVVDAVLAVVAYVADAVAGTWLTLPLGLVGSGLVILACWLVVPAILRLSVRFVGPDNLLVTYAPLVEVDVSVDVGGAHFGVGSGRLAFRTQDGVTHTRQLGGGLLEVLHNTVTILTDRAAPA